MRAGVLPMADEPVRTRVTAAGRELGFQEFMIVRRARRARWRACGSTGSSPARPTPAVLEALASADAIVIGPSNPVVSIGPILAVPGMREAMAAAAGPGGGGEPVRGRRGAQGPDPAVLRARRDRGVGGRPAARPTPGCSTAWWPTSRVEGVAALEIDTLMDTPERRREVAEKTLEFASSLPGRGG